MAKTLLDLYNLALVRAGNPPIISTEESSRAADVCRRFYPESRDEVLRMYDWSSAIRRIRPAAVAVSDLDDHEYAYRLPVDCVKLVSTKPESNSIIEGNFIYSDTADIIIRYVARVEDPSQFDDLLFKCITLRLAGELCVHLVQKPALNEFILKELATILPSAMNESGIEAKKSSDQNKFWDQV
jgi:hypothetical protein